MLTTAKSENILKLLIEKIILPAYPQLTSFNKIIVFTLSYHYEFNVYFIVKKKLDRELQEQIDTEVRNLFVASSLDTLEKRPHGIRNTVLVWFKTPREKDFSFHCTEKYESENHR